MENIFFKFESCCINLDESRLYLTHKGEWKEAYLLQEITRLRALEQHLFKVPV